MSKDSHLDDILGLEWEQSLFNESIKNHCHLERMFEYRDIQIFNQIKEEKHLFQQNRLLIAQKQHNFPITNLITQSQPLQAEIKSQSSKRQHSNSSSHQNDTKHHRNDKQKGYSKAYRQRIKQRHKSLEQENEYLKKRIKDLQVQLRQQEIQLNRLKFPPPDKELSVQELNKQFTQISVNYLKSLKEKPQQYNKQWYPSQSQYHKFFLQFYAERGFAGKKKLNILNYHFNEILQTLLKDTQKYLSLVFANSQSYDKLAPLPQFQAINNAYGQIYKPQGDLWSRLKTFNKFLHPMGMQLNKHISQFYKKYEEILCCCNKIHDYLKLNYHNNMDIGRRRFQMETWFEFHKYGKSMRKLRQKWFIWMKSLAQKDEQEQKVLKNGTKKKKVQQ